MGGGRRGSGGERGSTKSHIIIIKLFHVLFKKISMVLVTVANKVIHIRLKKMVQAYQLYSIIARREGERERGEGERGGRERERMSWGGSRGEIGGEQNVM